MALVLKVLDLLLEEFLVHFCLVFQLGKLLAQVSAQDYLLLVLDPSLAKLHGGLLQDVEEGVYHGLDALRALHVLVCELSLHPRRYPDDSLAQVRDLRVDVELPLRQVFYRLLIVVDLKLQFLDLLLHLEQPRLVLLLLGEPLYLVLRDVELLHLHL